MVMSEGRDNNKELPDLFKQVMRQLEIYNTEIQFKRRRAFALDNSYKKQILRIASILNEGTITTDNQMIGSAY